MLERVYSLKNLRHLHNQLLEANELLTPFHENFSESQLQLRKKAHADLIRKYLSYPPISLLNTRCQKYKDKIAKAKNEKRREYYSQAYNFCKYQMSSLLVQLEIAEVGRTLLEFIEYCKSIFEKLKSFPFTPINNLTDEKVTPMECTDSEKLLFLLNVFTEAGRKQTQPVLHIIEELRRLISCFDHRQIDFDIVSPSQLANLKVLRQRIQHPKLPFVEKELQCLYTEWQTTLEKNAFLKFRNFGIRYHQRIGYLNLLQIANLFGDFINNLETSLDFFTSHLRSVMEKDEEKYLRKLQEERDRVSTASLIDANMSVVSAESPTAGAAAEQEEKATEDFSMRL